jgi:hypothetical protein
MELNEMQNLVDEARILSQDALANLTEVQEALVRAADACLTTGLMNRADACASTANRIKIVHSIGVAFREGIKEIAAAIPGLEGE